LSPTFRLTVLFPSLWRHTRIAALLPAIISWRAAYGGRRRNKLRKRRQWATCSLRREPVFLFHFSKWFLIRQRYQLCSCYYHLKEVYIRSVCYVCRYVCMYVKLCTIWIRVRHLSTHTQVLFAKGYRRLLLVRVYTDTRF
jgi:hypothetical protein